MKGRYIRIILLILTHVLDCILKVFERMNRKKLNDFVLRAVTHIFSEKVFELRQYYDVVEKRIVNQVILSMPSFGCSHYFKRGGCGMCAFNHEIERYNLRFFNSSALALLIKWFFIGLDRFIDKIAAEVEVLTIFMAGSFLNGEELPVNIQDFIFDYFIESALTKIVFESRPEYIIQEKYRLIKYTNRAISCSKNLEIAIGLESSDDYIRNKLIGKGVTKKQYSGAIAIINDLGAVSNTYILIGAPYLNRQEIISKTVASVIYAWDQGSAVVSLEAYFVQTGTPWEEFHRNGLLKVPRLWDIIEVIEAIDYINQNWYLGEFNDWPVPIISSRNCPLCTEKVLIALDFLRKNHSVSVLKKLHCPCRGNNNIINLKKGGNNEF